MPGRLAVPDSNLSGMYSGWTSLSEAEPVPPVRMGESPLAKSCDSSSAPMPPGPMSPLCPGTERAARPQPSKSMSQCPAVWAASRTKGMPRSRQIRPTAAASCTAPPTLEPWAMTRSFVLGRMRGMMSAGSIRPALSQGTRSNKTPCFAKSCRGRMTALCSMELTRQWSPALSHPRMAILSPAVFPGVRMQWVASVWRKRPQSASRSRRVVSPALWALA